MYLHCSEVSLEPRSIILEARLDRGLVKFIFTMIDHSNEVIKFITIFKLYSINSTLGENYTDMGNIFNKIEISTINDPITLTVKELVEVCDFGLYSDILN